MSRNRTITAYYAQLYQREPQLYKWAGTAAFASFHIGEKMKMWNWKKSGVKSFSFTCGKGSRNIEDDFQIIRIINNVIFTEIGWVHLAFAQMDFLAFQALLLEKGRHQIIIKAFEKLNKARELLKINGATIAIDDMIWEANTEILWHEQSEVVQALFDKLSGLFSGAMTLFASFDYKINHHQTNSIIRSRFILFMFFNGFDLIRKNWFVPELTDLQHRWHWILNDILKKWKIVESDGVLINAEIEILANIEVRNLQFY
jgi:hypothetical protein